MRNIFFVIFLTLFIYPVNAQISSSYIENELIIWLEKGVNAEEFAARSSQGTVPKRLLSKRLNIWLFEFAENTAQREEKMNNLSLNNQVRYVQNNHYVTPRARTPNDTCYSQQWAPAKIGLPDAWGFTTGGMSADGDSIVVAVIDDGFSLNHEDLSFWKNTHEIPNNGIDDDKNGYVDDYDGWNAYDNNGNIPTDSLHGTHVTGIVGAIGNNRKGVCGVNWKVGILPVAGSSKDEATVVAAYSYVFEMRALYNETNGEKGAFIVSTNSSFGVDSGNPSEFPIWCAMYDTLGSVGILNCAATANGNWNVDQVGDVPCSCSGNFLIAVTNTTSSDEKYADAGYGVINIDLGAPGTEIYSTYPKNSYAYETGTSMATPQVAGAIALMYANMPQSSIRAYKNNPASFALLVRQLLLDGADKIAPLDGLVNSGRLNAYNAVQKAQCTVNFTNQTVAADTTVISCGNINVRNVTVNSGKLTLKAAGKVNIISGFQVKPGAKLEIIEIK
ncbi:MAG: S8 family serine peptidase [Dysgonamonadaceae bacterium]|jgi:subtilisin family serine protease|nr:S8 family serine peptidase [Dysgonamonadaceae bacterium]